MPTSDAATAPGGRAEQLAEVYLLVGPRVLQHMLDGLDEIE
jgi:hypothetical protein